MATGSGKTNVMAMLIAWQTVNAVRSPGSSLFSRGFLVVAPGITIRDRLRVLLPSDPDSCYAARQIVPQEMLPELQKAKVVVTNFHAFARRRLLETNKVGEAALSGWRNEPIVTEETEGEMLKRACGDLLGMKNVVVINDEAHHRRRQTRASSVRFDPLAHHDCERRNRREAQGLVPIVQCGGVGALLHLQRAADGNDRPE